MGFALFFGRIDIGVRVAWVLWLVERVAGTIGT